MYPAENISNNTVTNKDWNVFFVKNDITRGRFDTLYHSLCSPFARLPVQPPLLEDCKLFETLFEGDMATQAKEEWEKAMSELAQEEPELLQHFQKLSEAAGKVGKANQW